MSWTWPHIDHTGTWETAGPCAALPPALPTSSGIRPDIALEYRRHSSNFYCIQYLFNGPYSAYPLQKTVFPDEIIFSVYTAIKVQIVNLPVCTRVVFVPIKNLQCHPYYSKAKCFCVCKHFSTPVVTCNVLNTLGTTLVFHFAWDWFHEIYLVQSCPKLSTFDIPTT